MQHAIIEPLTRASVRDDLGNIDVDYLTARDFAYNSDPVRVSTKQTRSFRQEGTKQDFPFTANAQKLVTIKNV